MSIIGKKAEPEPIQKAQNAPVESVVEEVDPLVIESYIRTMAIANNIDPDLAVKIAKCESSLNPNAKHLISSATGIYQFTKLTWEWIKAEGDRTDYKASTREFVKWFPIYSGWWKDCL
jgi:soluble lytic murein transglycosylase-like protein